MNEGMYSSKEKEWGTPQHLFDELNKEFDFTLDPCATAANAKCKEFITKEQNGLAIYWTGYRVFMNPPYGREIGKWVEHAYNNVRLGQALVVGLLPARTDTAWFQDYIYKSVKEIRFLRGRLKFEGNNGVKNSAPFPSMVVIF